MKAAIPLPSFDNSKAPSLFQIPSVVKPITQFFTLLTTFISAFLLRKSNSIQAKLKSAANSMEMGWKQRGVGGSFRRTVEVWAFVISYIFKYLKVKRLKNGDPAVYSKANMEIATILRDKLLELGPTFIKLGQLLSTRIDILPKEFISALVSLQDQVPGFSGDISIKIIEEEFGQPITQLFDSFNKTPLAAASLGQVHRAVLNGKEVAVKIQRQGLRELFDMDLKNIKVLAKILDKLDPKTDGAQRDWGSIYDESAKLLYKEIDYENEAVNAIRFQENFKDTPWIKVPDVSVAQP
jgi:predicted unusual protein kinase regulating ubiquinone biosynthesis (AarF/ABC1/UbiB family)